ncbi:DUF4912 domain-containing protein [Candidatus Sumerlaeota bacterium]|nr:DUF4912 domain-containing protein [Candidatus Sumerlaeota bacterium]
MGKKKETSLKTGKKTPSKPKRSEDNKKSAVKDAKIGKPAPNKTRVAKTSIKKKSETKPKVSSNKSATRESSTAPAKRRKTASGKTLPASSEKTHPLIPEVISVELSKFEMEPPYYRKPSTSPQEGPPRELPMGYGDTRVVILVRDPEWIFAYWEINDKTRTLHNLPRGRHDKTLALRIFDVTGIEFNGSNANRFYDVIINDYAVSWYLRMSEVNRSWCVDLGYYDIERGGFVTLARSNIANTPPGGVSFKGDEEWMRVGGEEYGKILRLSGGFDIEDFRGSENLLRSIAERIKLQVERSQGASGAVSSGQTGTQNKKEDAFRLTVNTDLIVYGATQPGARVTIQGKSVPVGNDGTFSVYFSLPEGAQNIPVKAVNAGMNRECEKTLKITKETC